MDDWSRRCEFGHERVLIDKLEMAQMHNDREMMEYYGFKLYDLRREDEHRLNRKWIVDAWPMRPSPPTEERPPTDGFIDRLIVGKLFKD